MEGSFWYLLGKGLEGHDDAQAIPPTHAVCPNPNCPAQGREQFWAVLFSFYTAPSPHLLPIYQKRLQKKVRVGVKRSEKGRRG